MPLRQQNLLPENFTVGPHDVIIGRGKKCTQNPGNKRFKAIIQETLPSYSNAPTKVKKSEIILQVLSQLRCDGGIGFIKQATDSSGCFMQVEEASCRIAIAQAFRDALSDSYRSSKKNKQVRRLERLRGEQEMTALDAISFESVSRSMFFEEPAPMPTLCGSFMGKSSAELAGSAPSSAMPNLHDILNKASAVEFPFGNEKTASWPTGPTTQRMPLAIATPSRTVTPPASNEDIFAKLFAAFGQVNENATCNPFEPTPIAESAMTA